MNGPRFDVPTELVSSILHGRCIAFVGAGFSAPEVPTWTELLSLLAKRLEMTPDLPDAPDAFALEALGDQLQQRSGADWETHVQAVLAEARMAKGKEGQVQVQRRAARLLQIPFKAILTTNFDPSVPATHQTLDPKVFCDVLRSSKSRW